MERLKAGGVVGGLRGNLLAENLERFLARPADLLMHPRRPRLHLLVHPVAAALAIDDANPFADRVENQIGLLGNQGPLEGKEIGRVGKDGGKLIVTKGVDRFVNRGDLDHIAVDFEAHPPLRGLKRSGRPAPGFCYAFRPKR